MIVVRARETGDIIEEVSTIEEGRKVIEEFEAEDIRDEAYTENFYEIAEI